jgi:hypothetical protein
MPPRLLLATLLLAALPPCASAESHYYFGAIDKFPVVVALEQDGNKLHGWYFYRSQAKQIQLDGTLANDGAFRINELEDGKKAALFEGRALQGLWQGQWHKLSAGTAPLAFSLTEARDTAHILNGEVACSGKRHDAIANGQYQSTLHWNLKLAFAAGRARRFSASQTTRMDDGSEQACSIAMGDLRQHSSTAGALLQAKGDPADGGSAACSVRVIGDADTMVVTFGDPRQDGNDCRGVGSTMFCSARGGWADYVVDRRANTCKALQ